MLSARGMLPREKSTWKPEQVSCWFETLGEQGTIAPALAKELGAEALRLKLDGPTLRCMDTEAWVALGITDAIQRAACRAAFEQAGRLPTVGSNSAHLRGEIKVGFKINVLSISALDNVGQTFVCEFVLRGRTLNAAKLKTAAGEPVTVDNWEPRIRILNMLESSIWGMHASDGGDGELEVKWRICGTFGERMELESFPFDCQKLQLDISSAIPAHKQDDPSAKLLTFCNWEDRAEGSAAVQRRNFTQSNVFELGAKVTMKQTLSDVSESTSNTVRPVLRVALTAQRKPLYFFWNIMLPMALIEALAYGSFAVPREDVADRLSVSLTMVLTAVAFKQIIAAELPNVSYLTLLDMFVLASFASTCLVAFENIVMGQVASSPEGDAMLADVDKILSIVFPAVFAARLLLHVPHCWWHARRSCKLAGHVHHVHVEKPGSTGESRHQVVPKGAECARLEA